VNECRILTLATNCFRVVSIKINGEEIRCKEDEWIQLPLDTIHVSLLYRLLQYKVSRGFPSMAVWLCFSTSWLWRWECWDWKGLPGATDTYEFVWSNQCVATLL